MTTADSNSQGVVYDVVINVEDQYSIWPINKRLPLGWKNMNKTGSRTECLQYIAAVWTDMRPASLRKDILLGRSSDGFEPEAPSNGAATRDASRRSM
jgi:uncharacterized protein YbdZ (MbtH family)